MNEECLNIACRLPCRHQLAENYEIIHNVPLIKEYICMDKKVLKTIDKSTTNCMVEEKDKQIKTIDIDSVIKKLKAAEGTEAILNELAMKG